MSEKSPILNNPYEELRWHYSADLDGNLDYNKVIEGRRPYTAAEGIVPNHPNKENSNHDDQQFIVTSIHFCGGDKKEFSAWKKGLQGLANSSAKTKKKAENTLHLELSDDFWDTLYSFRSGRMLYEEGHKVAVRVISQFGEESSKVLTM